MFPTGQAPRVGRRPPFDKRHKPRMPNPPLLLGSLIAAGLLLTAPLRGQVPPDEAWRTLRTEHFRVTYPRDLAGLALRTGERAEAAYRELSRTFGDPPDGIIDVVLTDHADFTNGFADLIPWKRITIYARPPTDAFALIYFDDWLDLVVTHELAHIFHLDMTGPLGSAVRSVFGRVPAPWPVFPERGLPRWAVEGLATWYESALTPAGRIEGTFHDMVLRTAALEGALEDLDQASGESPVWPAGDRPYVYGSRFFDFLLERHGEEAMARFADAVAHQLVPYRIDAAGKDAFGAPLTEAWDAWLDSLRARASSLRDSLAGLHPLTIPEPVTPPERLALHPRVGGSGRLAWARGDERSVIQIRTAGPAGEEDRKLTRTNGLATLSWTPDGAVVFSQLEFAGPYRLRRDLYRARPDGGVERITRDFRLSHPDVHPDGDRAVAVQEGKGTNRLVTVELSTGTVRPLTSFRPDVHWSYPRWSPDGRRLAASRWERGGFYDVVVLDGEGNVLSRVTRDRAVDLGPAWGPDGRRLVWSSDRTGVQNLFGAEVDPASGRVGEVRQITNVLTGVYYPDVDPRGRWIFFSAYHAQGWGVERIPYDPGSWFEPFPTDPRFRGGQDAPVTPVSEENGDSLAASAQEPPGGSYSPFPSLWPKHWEPLYEQAQKVGGVEVVGPMYGALTEGRDLVGRHTWVGWLRFDPADDPRWEGSFGYRWAGLGNPVLGAGVAQFYDAEGPFLQDRPNAPGVVDTLFVEEVERRVDASASLIRRTVRSSATLTLTGSFVREEDLLRATSPGADTLYRLVQPDRDLAEGALTVSYSNAVTHPLSISREGGVRGFARLRVRRQLDLADSLAGRLGRDGAFEELTGRVELYQGIPAPGFANHVLALRVSGGRAFGPDADQFHFELGGASGRRETLTGFELFGGSSLLFPVRGFPRLFRRGSRAWSGSLEYRVPLAVVHEGLGAFPLYFDRLSLGAFLDGGNAWGPEEGIGGFQNPRRDALWSAGGEILASILPFWATVLDVRLGVAFPLVETTGRDFWDDTLYLRLGWSF